MLKALGKAEDSFLTVSEMQRLTRESGLQPLGHFVSSKEDWEFYTRPIFIAVHETIESESDLAEEAQKVMNGFKVEFAAVDQCWDMILWVLKSS